MPPVDGMNRNKKEESDKRGKIGGRAARRKTKVGGWLGAASFLPTSCAPGPGAL